MHPSWEFSREVQKKLTVKMGRITRQNDNRVIRRRIISTFIQSGVLRTRTLKIQGAVWYGVQPDSLRTHRAAAGRASNAALLEKSRLINTKTYQLFLVAHILGFRGAVKRASCFLFWWVALTENRRVPKKTGEGNSDPH